MNKRMTVAAALTFGLVLSACGGGDSGNGNGGGADGDAEGGGEFNIAWNAQPPSMDPLMATSNATRDLARNVFEPLLTLDANSEVQPVLAEGFELAEDNESITFTLRESVPFHDGSSMEVEDVIASIEYWIEHSRTANQYLEGAEVSSPEENVVQVDFAGPMPAAPQLFAHQNQFQAVMPAELIENAGPEGVAEFIGTGPYELGEWATDQHIRFDKFGDYASPEGETSGTAGEKNPYFDTIFYHFVGDASTRVSGMQSGEYDAAASIPWDNAEMFDGDDNVYLDIASSGFSLTIFNKAEGEIMADQSMRQAVMAASEPETSLEAAFATEEFFSLNASLLPEESPFYSEVDVELQANQDIDAAQELLEEAGYDGEVVRMITTRDYPQLYNLSVMLQQHLEEAGVNTDMVVADWPTVSNEINNPGGDWDIYIDMVSWASLPNMQSHTAPSGVGLPDDPDLEASLEAILMAEGDEEARQAVSEFHEVYYDYLPAAPFGHVTLVTALNSDYEGFDFVAPSGAIYYNMRDAQE